MKNNAPLLFAIKGNSLDDGPGIRSVIFFKGCPLDCVWCHNPESKNPGTEISYDPKKCAGCGHCIETCAEKALSRKNKFYINRKRCTLCYACVRECPTGALEGLGYEMAADDIVREVTGDKPFFDNSGGGATLSGGEPTLHMEFAAEISRSLKDKGISVLLETCGLFTYRRFKELLSPQLDMIYFDIKIYDAAAHKKYCGADNSVILNNFVRLLADAENGGPPILPRVPLVPDITDTEENIMGIAGFLKDHGATKVQILPYNPLWLEKIWSIGSESVFIRKRKMTVFMALEKIDRCKGFFRSAGLEV